MRGVFAALTVLMVLGSPRLAVAEGECEDARALRGPISEVRVSSGTVRLPSGEPISTPHRDQRWTYLANRQRITVVKYQADPFSIGYPTTVCEYDDAGRLTKQTFKLNGWTAHTVTTLQYDAKGRLIVRDTRSKNPALTLATTYEYGNGTVTERFASGAYTTRHLDADGHLLKEVAYRPENGAALVTTTEYQRTPGEVKACSSGGASAGCRTSRFDNWGNVVEVKSGSTVTTSNTYEIDARGNWTKRVSALHVNGKPPTMADVTFREIAYRSQ